MPVKKRLPFSLRHHNLNQRQSLHCKIHHKPIFMTSCRQQQAAKRRELQQLMFTALTCQSHLKSASLQMTCWASTRMWMCWSTMPAWGPLLVVDQSKVKEPLCNLCPLILPFRASNHACTGPPLYREPMKGGQRLGVFATTL